MTPLAKSRKAFQLERLEARDCPAFNIFYTNAALLIRGRPTLPFVNPGDGLQLHLLANGAVQVTEVGGATTINYGSYRPTPNIQIFLTNNTDHDFTFDLGTRRMLGNVFLNLGIGNTDFFSINRVTFSNGEIGGNLTILGGSGGEVIDLGTSEGPGGTSNLPLTVDGNTSLALSPNQSFFGDTLFVNAGSLLLGQLATVEVDNVNIGELPAGPNTGNATVVGNVSLSVPRSRNVGKLDIFGTVEGNANFQGSPAIDPVFSDAVVVEPAGTVQGNLTASLGAGSGVLNIQGTVEQNINFAGAQGNNFVGLSGSVLGSTQVNLRDGSNIVQLTGSVAGDLNVRAGNGNNDLTDFTGLVNGNLGFNLGNGTDDALIANAPGGGRLSWVSGNGADSLTLGSAATLGSEAWNVNVRFGNNDDTFTLAGTGTTQLIQGRVDGGNRFTANDFVMNANWVLTPNFSLINFP